MQQQQQQAPRGPGGTSLGSGGRGVGGNVPRLIQAPLLVRGNGGGSVARPAAAAAATTMGVAPQKGIVLQQPGLVMKQQPGMTKMVPLSNGGTQVPPSQFQGVGRPPQLLQSLPPIMSSQRPPAMGNAPNGSTATNIPPQRETPIMSIGPQGPKMMMAPPAVKQQGPPMMDTALQGPRMMDAPTQRPSVMANAQIPPHMMAQPLHTAPLPPHNFPPQQQQQRGSISINPAHQCPPNYQRLTVSKFPQTAQLLSQTGIPLGGVVQPLAQDPEGKEIPLIDFGSSEIMRCRRCRAYINPFVTWFESGHRWRCSICELMNDTPNQYYHKLDENGVRLDVDQRVELHSGIFEIAASTEYMVRPPIPPVYVFVIDVSYDAVASGMLKCVADTIKASLDDLLGAPRTKMAIFTFDNSVHFYNLSANLSFPRMLVVSDIDDLFLPIPGDLLVDIWDSRDVIEKLLDALPMLHANAKSADCALGPVLNVAFAAMEHIGGKLCLFQTKLPNLGEGFTSPRDFSKLLSSDRAKTLSQGIGEFFKVKAHEFSRQQICVELFVFPKNYQQPCDLETVSVLAKNTGGQLHYFPAFHFARDEKRLFRTLNRSLSRETAWESVMRIRASSGVKMSAFHGNFIVRGTDLLSLPNCDADASFGFELAHEQGTMVATQTVTVQTALLYTNSNKQRRIRVITQCIPVVNSVGEIFDGADGQTIAMLLAKATAETAFIFGPEEARRQLKAACSDILQSFRMFSLCSTVSTSTPGMQSRSSFPAPPPNNQQQTNNDSLLDPSFLPPGLFRLPILVMSLIKHPAFRGGTDVLPDERIFWLFEFCRLPLDLFDVFVYPSLYAIHTLPPGAGEILDLANANLSAYPSAEEAQSYCYLEDKSKLVKLPPTLSLTAQNLDTGGAYLLNNGVNLQLLIGRNAPSALIQSLFRVPSLDKIDHSVLRLVLKPGDDNFKTRICNLINGLQHHHPSHFPALEILPSGDTTETNFFSRSLIEDRAPFPGGSLTLTEFISQAIQSPD